MKIRFRPGEQGSFQFREGPLTELLLLNAIECPVDERQQFVGMRRVLIDGTKPGVQQDFAGFVPLGGVFGGHANNGVTFFRLIGCAKGASDIGDVRKTQWLA